MIRFLLTLPFLCSIVLTAASQKGMPSETPTAATVNTNFAQHEEFNDSLLKRLQVPQGFTVFIAAKGLGKPRMIAEAGKGKIYITRRDQGDVLLLSDTDGDGVMDELKTALADFKGVHGIVVRDAYVYLCANRELKRGKITATGTIQDLEPLITDLPDGGQHPNRTIAFGPDGKLYISVGSDCNDCGESNEEHATMLIADEDGRQRKIFARGLRNTIGFDWQPGSKALWGADNGTDWRGDDKPHEELNQISRSGDYGWPLVYDDQQVDSTREDPPGTTKKEYAKKTVPPALLLPAHAAPINFIFPANKEIYSKQWKEDAIVSLHGSWNRRAPEGFVIKRISFKDGRPTGITDFLSGFYNKKNNTRFGRPAGLLASSWGVIYVTDDANGILYGIKSK